MSMIKLVTNPDLRPYLPLFIQSGKETNLGYEVSPDWDKYNLLMNNGAYVFIGAEKDGEPIGYLGMFIIAHLFNPDVVHAHADSFFVRPDYRKTHVPGLILREMMGFVRSKHAHDLMFGCPIGSALEKVLVKRGFHQAEINYRKFLKE